MEEGHGKRIVIRRCVCGGTLGWRSGWKVGRWAVRIIQGKTTTAPASLSAIHNLHDAGKEMSTAADQRCDGLPGMGTEWKNRQAIEGAERWELARDGRRQGMREAGMSDAGIIQERQEG